MQQFVTHDIYVVDLPGLHSLANHVGRESYCAVYISASEESRKERMTATRGAESAEARIQHDREAFAHMESGMFDFVLENETPEQLVMNIEKLHELLQQRKP